MNLLYHQEKEKHFFGNEWAYLIDNAMMYYNTKMFYNEVMRVKDSLLDIKKTAQIKLEVEKYYETVWFPTCFKRFKTAVKPNTMLHWQKIHWNRIRNEEAIHLLNFIRQTIQNKGYGFKIARSFEVGHD